MKNYSAITVDKATHETVKYLIQVFSTERDGIHLSQGDVIRILVAKEMKCREVEA